MRAHARRLLAVHPVVDGRDDLPWAVRQKTSRLGDIPACGRRERTPGQTDLERLRAGGVGGQPWSVDVPGEIGSGFARPRLPRR